MLRAALAAPGQAEPLSVACRWFDRECAGYLEGEDLEEIIFMVSDAISSALPCCVLPLRQLPLTAHRNLVLTRPQLDRLKIIRSLK